MMPLTAHAGRRALAAVLLVGAVVVGVWPSAGTAAYRQKQGWWWRAQTGLLDVPPPSTVPVGGFAVGQSADGETAVAAVAFQLSAEEIDPTLVIEVANDLGGPTAALRVCPTLASWAPATAGAWDLRPGPKCALHSADGQRSDDGSTWSFDLSSFPHDGLLDIIIMPADDSPPFELTFDAIDSDSLVTSTAAPTTVTAPPSVPPPPTVVTTVPPPPAPTFTPPVTTAGPTFAPVTPTVPTSAPAVATTPPPTSAPALTTIALGSGPNPRRLGIFVLVMAAAAIAMGWGETVRAPAALGPIAHRRALTSPTRTAAPADVRGVGRFRSTRSDPPPKLF